MTVSAMRMTIPIKEYSPAAVPEAVRAVATEDTPVVEEEVVEEEAVQGDWSGRGRARHTHRHVQRHLKHLNRDIRHAVFDAIQEAKGLDKETVKEIRGLTKEFRMDLQSLFHEADRGQDLDPQAVLGGIAEAMREFSEGLVALRERYVAVVEEDPEIIPVVGSEESVSEGIVDEPGTVLSVLA